MTKLPILFYNGWGMDENTIAHLHDGRTVIHINNHPQPFPLLKEPHILIAWSMGVWAAHSLLANRENIALAIAINGTPWGIHETYGISPRLFRATAARYNEQNREPLYHKIFGQVNSPYRPNRPAENQKKELETLIEACAATYPEVNNHWDKAIISRHDPIFDSTAQQHYWAITSTDTIIVDTPHHPFQRWRSWEALLADCCA